MANAYFEHMAVSSAQEASILSNEYTWIILEALRSSGSKGLTPKEVHQVIEREESTTVSASKIYSILKRLYEIEWIHRHYDSEVKAQRNTLAIQWGEVEVVEEFSEVVEEKMKRYIKKEFFPIILDYYKKTINDFATDEENKKWLPSSGTAGLCKKCHSNHEADEFFYSLMQEVIFEFNESDEFIDFQKKYDYIDQDYEL